MRHAEWPLLDFEAQPGQQHLANVGEAVRESVFHALGRVEHAAAAQRDDGIGRAGACRGERSIDRLAAGVLADFGVGAGERGQVTGAVEREHPLHAIDEAGRDEAAIADEQDTPRAQPLQNRRQADHGAGGTMDAGASPEFYVTGRHVPRPAQCSNCRCTTPCVSLRATGERSNAVVMDFVSRKASRPARANSRPMPLVL